MVYSFTSEDFRQAFGFAVDYHLDPTKQQIGNAIGIDIGASVACIVDAGEDQGMLEKIIEKVSKLKD